MRILVIRSYRLGDLVQITPFLAALRRLQRGAAIHILTEEHFSHVLADHPAVAHIHAMPKTQILARYGNAPESLPRQIAALGSLLKRLRSYRFDWVINRQAAPLEAVVAGLCGGRQISGPHYDPSSDQIISDPVSAAFAETIRTDRRAGRTNVVDHSFHVAGIPITDDRLYLPLDSRARHRVHRVLKTRLRREDAILIGLQAGASQGSRHADPMQLLGAAEIMLEDPRIHLLVFGGRHENQLGDILAGGLSDPGRLIRLEGQTTWQALKAFLASCHLLITPDTGPMHVAAAVGTRVVALFWESAYAFETGPYGPGHIVLQTQLACAPCAMVRPCPHLACRSVLESEHIARAAHLSLTAQGLCPGFVTEPYEVHANREDLPVRFWSTGEEPWQAPFALRPFGHPEDGATDQAWESKIQAIKPAIRQ